MESAITDQRKDNGTQIDRHYDENWWTGSRGGRKVVGI